MFHKESRLIQMFTDISCGKSDSSEKETSLSIKRDGEQIEKDLIVKYGFSKSAHKEPGDLKTPNGNCCEVKKIGGENTSFSINQVRAWEYVPIVVVNMSSGDIYVIPGNIIVRHLIDRNGQHCPSQFISASFSLKSLEGYQNYKIDPDNILSECDKASLEDQKFINLKIWMDKIRQDNIKLAYIQNEFIKNYFLTFDQALICM
jgi:hypothetical protein